MRTQRDNYIDLVRGLCALSVIFIHTAFWSGGDYVPTYMKSVSLLFDVPVFFFLAGATIGVLGESRISAPKQIAKLIFYFFALVLTFQILFWNFSIERLIQPLVLAKAIVPEFKVISGSYWFVPTYCISILFAQIIYQKFPRLIYPLMGGAIFYYLVIYFFNYRFKIYVLGQPFQNILFYVALILLGYKLYLQSFPKWIYCLLAACFGLLLSYTVLNDNSSISEFYLQKYKFPVQLPYVLASLTGIFLILALKTQIVTDFLLTRLLCFVGENAIFFYMSQGVSSSLIYYLSPYLMHYWPMKLLIMFLINVTLAMFIGVLFYKIDKFFAPYIRAVVYK